jgi:Uma2 family endonuclease
MATKTLLRVQDYAALDEPEGVRYELSNGELIVTPSAGAYHNTIRDDFNSCLRAFMKVHQLGDVYSETDMKLAGEVVRRPDIAFIPAGRLA